MNRHAASLLCAAALAAASARPARAQSSLQQCDASMTDAEAMAQQVVRCAQSLAESRAALKATAASAAPAKGPAPDVIRTSTTVYIEISSGTIPDDIDLAARAAPLAFQLMTYYSVSAFAAGDLALCSPLAFLKQESDCRREALELIFQRAWQGGGAADFKSACAQFRADFGEQFGAQCCATLEANRGGNPCPKLVPQCVPDLQACGSFLAPSAGPAGTCSQIKPGLNFGCTTPESCAQERQDCLGDAAYAAAARAKNAALCRGSDRCRALMGEGKRVAQEQAAELTKTPAGRWFLKREWLYPTRRAVDVLHPPAQPSRAPRPPRPATAAGAAPNAPATFKGFTCEEPLSSPANRKAVTGAIGAVHACLVRYELAVPLISKAIAADLDAREEKLARLNLRMNAIFDGK